MITAFVEYLIQNHALEEDCKEEAVYGLTLLAEKILVYLILFCVAMVIRKPVEGIIFMISFVLLRQTTGGFHAESFAGCLACSVLTLLAAVGLIAPLVQRDAAVAGILLLLAVVCIVYFAPVNHPNVALSGEEVGMYRRWSRLVLVLELGVSVVGYLVQMQWQTYIIVAVMFCAVFIGIAKIIKQEVTGNED